MYDIKGLSGHHFSSIIKFYFPISLSLPAVGCVQPVLPHNVVQLEFNPNEGHLKVACEHPDFVFPDSSYSERVLTWNSALQAWDKSIPHCTGETFKLLYTFLCGWVNKYDKNDNDDVGENINISTTSSMWRLVPMVV